MIRPRPQNVPRGSQPLAGAVGLGGPTPQEVIQSYVPVIKDILGPPPAYRVAALEEELRKAVASGANPARIQRLQAQLEVARAEQARLDQQDWSVRTWQNLTTVGLGLAVVILGAAAFRSLSR